MSVTPAQGGITAPEGYLAAGIACGIKASGLDLALLVTQRPATAAALFTTNRAAAAPVQLSRRHLGATGGHARAIVTNSGCANACTGAAGDAAARTMAERTAAALGCRPEEVLVASTGVIGVALDPATVSAGISAAAAALDRGNADLAARAIMTTDPWPKSHAVEVTTLQGRFRVGGMAKGSGMIEPNLATMLAYLTTDAEVSPTALRLALAEVCDDTFNAITVDGECSTNDAVFVLANGASGVRIDGRAEREALVGGLRAVARELALGIVRGGEGATKLVTVRVAGAASREDARVAARAIANSLLVKTAVHGGDPNWGRLVAVAGRCGAAFELSRARVAIGEVDLFAGGQPHDDRAAAAAAVLRGPEVAITVNLGTGGPHGATVWTCDLSAEYVRINAEYRT
jgi:glutamate N-acetyltransferase/amino-acid N-acetyltransferase